MDGGGAVLSSFDRTVLFVRAAGETKRYHTQAMLREQNVAEHQHHVMMLCALIQGPGVRAELLMAAATHDAAEHVMGDLPAPAKRNMPPVAVVGTSRLISFREQWGSMEEAMLLDHGLEWGSGLSTEEKRILKVADNADGCFICVRERAMGNKLIKPVYANFRDYMDAVINMKRTRERSLLELIDSQWKDADE